MHSRLHQMGLARAYERSGTGTRTPCKPSLPITTSYSLFTAASNERSWRLLGTLITMSKVGHRPKCCCAPSVRRTLPQPERRQDIAEHQ